MARILLVEDDQLLVRLYTKKMTKKGFEVEVANDGGEGLIKAQNRVPDLILLDLMMPKVDGFELLQILADSPQLKDVMVVILTNVSSDRDEKRARELGAVDYIVKSDNLPAQIVDRIEELLR